MYCGAARRISQAPQSLGGLVQPRLRAHLRRSARDEHGARHARLLVGPRHRGGAAAPRVVDRRSAELALGGGVGEEQLRLIQLPLERAHLRRQPPALRALRLDGRLLLRRPHHRRAIPQVVEEAAARAALRAAYLVHRHAEHLQLQLTSARRRRRTRRARRRRRTRRARRRLRLRRRGAHLVQPMLEEGNVEGAVRLGHREEGEGTAAPPAHAARAARTRTLRRRRPPEAAAVLGEVGRRLRQRERDVPRLGDEGWRRGIVGSGK